MKIEIKDTTELAISKVRELFPKAKTSRDGALFSCHEGSKDLGVGFSEDLAWESAARNIN